MHLILVWSPVTCNHSHHGLRRNRGRRYLCKRRKDNSSTYFHRSLLAKADASGLVSLGDQFFVKAVYSRSEKSSRPHHCPEVCFGTERCGLFDLPRWRPAQLRRDSHGKVRHRRYFRYPPDQQATRGHIESSCCREAGVSEKPISEDVTTGIELVRKYVSEYRPDLVSWGGLQRTSSTSLSIKRRDGSSARAR